MSGKRKRLESEISVKNKSKREKKEKKIEEKEEEGEENVLSGGKKEIGFECGVCFDLMCWEKIPKMLPSCGHTFCSICLTKLFQLQQPSSSSSSSSSSSPSSSSSSSASSSSWSGIHCPVCREENEFDSVEVLEENFLIAEAIDILVSSNLLSLSNQSPKQPETECFNFKTCGERTQMYCPRCEMFICDSCDPSHTSTVFTQQHKRQYRIRDLFECTSVDELEIIKKRQCSNHPSELIVGYCFGCSVLVCGCCISENHSSHRKKVSSLEESVLKKRKEVVKVGAGVGKRLEIVEEKIDKTEERIEELEERLQKKRAKMKDLKLEREDLTMREDTIVRLSNTPPDYSLFDEDLFSSLLQIVHNVVIEGNCESELPLFRRKRGVICCDGVKLISSFDCPAQGVTSNSEGLFIVACEGDDVRVMDREGDVIQSLSEVTKSLNEDVIDVAVGVDDQILVLSKSRVLILDKKGQFIKFFEIGSASRSLKRGRREGARGISVDEQGRIIVADTGDRKIKVFDKDGNFIRSFSFFAPSSPLSFRQSTARTAFDPESPCCVEVDGDGNLVISESYRWNKDRISVTSVEGDFIQTFGTKGSDDGQFIAPQGVAVDGEGKIVVCDSGNGRMSVFDKDGTFLFSFGEGQMKKPYGVVVDLFGSILVSDRNRNVQLWK